MGFSCIADVTPTMVSGREVAIATSKKLMVNSDIPMCLASFDEDEMNSATAFIRIKDETTIITE